MAKTDAQNAHSDVAKMIQDDEPRAKKRTRVSGMISGKPPYNPTKLREAGQGHRCNTNFREGEGIMNSRYASLFDLFLDTKTLIDARIRNRNIARGYANHFESIIMTELHELLEEWTGFDYEMMMNIISQTEHGMSSMIFTDEDDWRPQAFGAGAVLFPEKTKAHVDAIECYAVMDTLSASRIVELMKNDKAAELGWSMEVLKKALALIEGNQQSTDTRLDELQKEIEAQTYNAATKWSPVQIAHIYSKEKKDGESRIMHRIILRDTETEKFLFEGKHYADKMKEFTVPFPANIGNGYFHSIKGLGHKVFPTVETNNRFLCRAVDGAMDSASLIVSFKAGQANRGKTIRMGSQIYLPPGAELARNETGRNIQGLTYMHQLLTAISQSSVGQKRPGITALSQDDKGKNTARGETINATNEAKMEKMEINFYYKQWDLLYSIMGPRIFKFKDAESRAFKERCIEKGVPEKLMNAKYWKFKAPRLIGHGSATMKHLLTQDLLQIASHLPQIGKQNLIQDFIAARGTPDHVDRYYPVHEDGAIPTRAHQMAQFENNDLMQSQNCIVSTEDWHVIHMEVHLDFFMSYGQKVVQSGDPNMVMEAVKAIGVIVDHMGNHMAYLKGDELHEAKFPELQQRFKKFIQMVKAIQGAAQSIEEDQKKQAMEKQKELEELQARGDQAEIQKHIIDAQQEMQFRMYKEDHNHHARMIKLEHSLELAERKANAEIAKTNREG